MCVYSDMKDTYPAQYLKDVCMTINWVNLYNSWNVMAGQWGYTEQFIANQVKDAATKI